MKSLPMSLPRRIALVSLLAWLSGCNSIPKTELLQPVRSTVTEVDVAVRISSFQRPGSLAGMQPIDDARRDALNRLIPALLTKNGVTVRQYEEPGERNYQATLARMASQEPKDRYLLLIEGEKYVVENNTYYTVIFDVRLVDRSLRRAVWKASVKYSIVKAKINAPAEIFVRDLLLGMAKDKLIVLPSPDPIDLKGNSISNSPIWEDDR